MGDYAKRVAKAVKHFWVTRKYQAAKQGQLTGRRDAGLRAAVTGGKHLDGFVTLCRELLIESGIPDAAVYWRKQRELPGFFRPEKSWDLLAVVDGTLLAVIEFKAQVGPSFGNNFNNRAEEALGNATDFWAAYREGAFKPSQRPWLGYLFLLEESPRSRAPIRVCQPHYPAFTEFQDSSYAKRYELLLTKLMRERLYDATCLLLSPQKGGLRGEHHSPSEELSFQRFATSLMGHAIAYVKNRDASS